jgi:hypothetical protein
MKTLSIATLLIVSGLYAVIGYGIYSGTNITIPALIIAPVGLLLCLIGYVAAPRRVVEK